MLGFIFDALTFLRWGYIVLCIIVGIGVVVGFLIKVVRKVFKIKTFDEEYFDSIRDGSYWSKKNDMDEILSRLNFGVGRRGRPDNTIQSFKGGKYERESGNSDVHRGE